MATPFSFTPDAHFLFRNYVKEHEDDHSLFKPGQACLVDSDRDRFDEFTAGSGNPGK
jgi:hypothetical protein